MTSSDHHKGEPQVVLEAGATASCTKPGYPEGGKAESVGNGDKNQSETKGMLDGLTPLTIGPQEGSCGSSVNGEAHGDGEHEHDEEHDGFAHLLSPQIKPSRSPGGMFPLKAVSPGKASSGMTKVHSMNDMAILSLETADTHDMTANLAAALAAAHKGTVLEHTTGTVKEDGGAHVLPKGSVQLKMMKRSVSNLDMHGYDMDDSMWADVEEPTTSTPPLPGKHLLVILDMDHTMVGNLVALSDRDNVESNIEWDFWPEGVEQGLSPAAIVPYLSRGMLRPGMANALEYMRDIGATVVVYTHSEYRWAAKVCEAMEMVVGFKFIKRLFSRSDCKDGHPEFLAKKSLEFIVNKLRDEDGLDWATVDNTVMFDDDRNALYPGEVGRLVIVPSYDYWEACRWNEVITDEVLKKNSEEIVDLVQRTVVEWGVAPPSYGKDLAALTEEEKEMDLRWQAQKDKKMHILMQYNKLSKLDRLWVSIKSALASVQNFDNEHMESFPERCRKMIGKVGGRGMF